MSDNAPNVEATSDANRPAAFTFHIGAKTPKYKPGRKQRPSLYSCADANVPLRILDALLNLEIIYETPLNNPDGTPGTATPRANLTEQKLSIILPGIVGSGGTSPDIVLMNAYQEFQAYILCSYGGTRSSSGANIQVIKPAMLLYNQSVLLTDGYHTYTSTGVNTRTDLCGGVTVNEVIWPPYITTHVDGGAAQGVILACHPSNMPAGYWYDLNVDARKWVQIAVPCDGSDSQLADISFPY